MTRGPWICALLAVAALAGCGGKSSKEEVPAAVVPPDAAAYVELDISPDGAAQTAADRFLRRLVPGFGSGGARLRALVDGALRGTGATYEKSVEPWIGDRVPAVLGTSVHGEGDRRPRLKPDLDAEL